MKRLTSRLLFILIAFGVVWYLRGHGLGDLGASASASSAPRTGYPVPSVFPPPSLPGASGRTAPYGPTGGEQPVIPDYDGPAYGEDTTPYPSGQRQGGRAGQGVTVPQYTGPAYGEDANTAPYGQARQPGQVTVPSYSGPAYGESAGGSPTARNPFAVPGRAGQQQSGQMVPRYEGVPYGEEPGNAPYGQPQRSGQGRPGQVVIPPYEGRGYGDDSYSAPYGEDDDGVVPPYTGTPYGQAPSGRQSGPYIAGPYQVGGVTVVDNRTGREIALGTVDLRPTLQRIAAGQRDSHPNDGTVYRNLSRALPQHPSGYYREFVVPTQGLRGPGPQRLILGDGGEIYYTYDHYQTFIPIRGN